jgi:hypothetical protein
MPEFCLDGYVSTGNAILSAAQRWFAEQFHNLERTRQAPVERKPEGHIEQAIRAFSNTEYPEEFEHIANQTVLRIRNLLHRGELTAYYFDNFGRQSVSRDFWATAEADNGFGVYWPFGRPSRVLEQRPNFPLFFLQSELDRVLSAQPGKKRSLPRSKTPELVIALRELAGLPNRQAQYEALCELSQFREFQITRADFREAARHLPRRGGRKSRRESRR